MSKQLTQWLFYALSPFVRFDAMLAGVAGTLFGLWCVRLAWRYAALLRCLSAFEDGFPDGVRRVYNVFDDMRYSGRNARLSVHVMPGGCDPGALLWHALFRGKASSAGASPTGCGAACWGLAVLCGACVAVFYCRHGLGPACAGLGMAVGMLAVLAIVDARTSLLPDALTMPLLWLGLCIALIGGTVPLHDSVAGAMAGYLFLWLLFWGFKLVRGRDGMGHGDFKLCAALGAWVGAHALAYVLLAACAMGILFACARRKCPAPADGYPFGPFLALGGAGAMLARAMTSIYGW